MLFCQLALNIVRVIPIKTYSNPVTSPVNIADNSNLISPEKAIPMNDIVNKINPTIRRKEWIVLRHLFSAFKSITSKIFSSVYLSAFIVAAAVVITLIWAFPDILGIPNELKNKTMASVFGLLLLLIGLKRYMDIEKYRRN